ncbi:MAG: hypothetical protein HYU81_01275 [Candidatus Brennerbacteria bacterium]|nr:hypothetical protein [Candidatus Brennerbacteria bacterium]
MDINQKIRSAPRDVFLHLLAFVALYAAATAFLTVAFQLVNLRFPDILEGRGYYAFDGARNALRWALASFVIVFPVYVFVARFLRKEYEAIPEKRELKVRKWLVSFTLFAVAVTLISDLVSLLSHFLEGELTARFILKIAAVAFVAGAVGAYYLWALSGRSVTRGAKIAVSGILLVLAVGVVAGFASAGSPSAERFRRVDVQRVQDLQMIQGEIINHWQRKAALPENFETLTDRIRGVTIPRDPETRVSYEYRVTGDLSFELCAVFARASEDGGNARAPKPFVYSDAYEEGESWIHPEGRACFARTIDPDLYRLPSR